MRINVYCLEIVSTGEVFYVGATSKPLEIRYNAHRQSPYDEIRDVFKVNEVRIRLLQSCYEKNAAKVENKWIEYYGLTRQRKSAYTLKSYATRHNRICKFLNKPMNTYIK